MTWRHELPSRLQHLLSSAELVWGERLPDPPTQSQRIEPDGYRYVFDEPGEDTVEVTLNGNAVVPIVALEYRTGDHRQHRSSPGVVALFMVAGNVVQHLYMKDGMSVPAVIWNDARELTTEQFSLLVRLAAEQQLTDDTPHSQWMSTLATARALTPC